MYKLQKCKIFLIHINNLQAYYSRGNFKYPIFIHLTLQKQMKITYLFDFKIQ